MSRRDKKDPSKLVELSHYDLAGSLKSLIERFQAIVDEHPNAHIESYLDYRSCYYESDLLEVKFTIRSKQPK